MKKKWLVLVMAVVFLIPTAISTQEVSAAKYKPYSYWCKKDLYGNKWHSVVLTKNITIRKIKWHKEGVGHEYLAQKKVLKKGSRESIRSVLQFSYYWAFNKYSNWCYPHKTANWFETEAQYNAAKRKKQKAKEKKAFNKKTKKYDIFLEDNIFYIKNKGQLTIGDAINKQDSINLFCSFTNKSKTELNVADIFNKYVLVTMNGVPLTFIYDDYLVKPGKSLGIQLTSSNISQSPSDQITVAEVNSGIHTDGHSLYLTLK
ncbi:hypothetical protein [Lactobacillus sp. ESL0681]|uniref:hypothetical protein n=1 Tax=Lactobacillus sp. ESL0681 TaxID=2983211 RepID=UPI0023F732D3|nr:hypothetical protein [Lactobacillus sp. ESL0681]WEV40527.1 hypothetical protein OZX59_01030 [Lactobacillus sp. ESL0681]